MSAPLLRLRDISVVYSSPGGKRFQAVKDVSLTLERGQALALVGQSGSGKSTVSKVVARLVNAAAGSMELDGKDMLSGRVDLAFRRRVQMIFQDPFASLNPAHTVAHHVARPMLRHGRATRANVREKVIEMLTSVGLTPAETYADRRPFALSGGQRQRVAIARALAVQPDVLLADEPTSMLDVSIRRDILDLLRRLKADLGVGMLVVTHDLPSARYLADEIAVMYEGQIVEHGPAGEVVDIPQHPYTQLLLSSVAGSTRRAPQQLEASAS